jgi:hypothetical protein
MFRREQAQFQGLYLTKNWKKMRKWAKNFQRKNLFQLSCSLFFYKGTRELYTTRWSCPHWHMGDTSAYQKKEMTRDYTNELEEQRHRDTFFGSKMLGVVCVVCAAGPKWVEQRSTKLTRLGHTWGGYESAKMTFCWVENQRLNNFGTREFDKYWKREKRVKRETQQLLLSEISREPGPLGGPPSSCLSSSHRTK